MLIFVLLKRKSDILKLHFGFCGLSKHLEYIDKIINEVVM